MFPVIRAGTRPNQARSWKTHEKQTNMSDKKCGCGRTQNPQGNCDGTHAKPVQKTEPKRCGCGKTKNPQGYCDGTHAK